MSKDDFKVKIENAERRGQRPTYAVLGEAIAKANLWCLKDTLQLIRESQIKPGCLFMLIADQQTPSPAMVGDDVDLLFGLRLTGAKRITNTGSNIWTGDYAIARKELISTAGLLYKDYNHFTSLGTQEADAIIVDVLNPNNNWLYSEERKKRVEEELSEHVINRILLVYDKMGVDRPILLFAGFGRGALLAYHLASRMTNESSKVVLVSIDPRVNEGHKDEKKLIREWHVKTKKHLWRKDSEYYWKSVTKRPTKERTDYFPVLRSLQGVSCYNVFQRHNFSSTAMKKSAAWPVGCAIDGAISPGDFNITNFEPCDGAAAFNQWDVNIGEHATQMLDRYAPWIIDVAEREGLIATPLLEGISPEGGVAGGTITLTGHNLNGCDVIIRAYDGSHPDLTVSQVNAQPDGKTLTFTYPYNFPPGLKKIFLNKFGKYSTDLTFKAAPYISSVSKTSQIVGKEVTLSGYFSGGWTLHISGSGFDEKLEMSGNGNTVTFTVPHTGVNNSAPNVGLVKLRAESAEGVMGTDTDFVIAPYIRSISPAEAAPGTNVDVHVYVGDGGVSNFLRFCNTYTSPNLNELSHDNGIIEVQVPNDIQGGEYDVVLMCTDSGNNDIYSNTEHFTVNSIITALRPTVQVNGLNVEVLGAGFNYDDKVLQNGSEVDTEVVNTQTLNFEVHTDVGKKEVVVQSKDGRRSNPATYGVAPYIDTSASPAQALPGEEIILKGYFNLHGILFYRGLDVDSTLVDENTRMFTVPEMSAGNGELKIKYDFDKAGNIVNFAVKAKITALSRLAVEAGEVLTITGLNFTDACLLYINGVEVVASRVGSNTFQWTVPNDAEPGPRSVAVVDTTTGLAGNAMEFGVTPYIKSLSTESEAPGATIVAHGYFSPDDHIQMEGKEAATRVIDDLTLSFTMPLLQRGGSGDVVVIEGERRSNGVHCDVNFVPWPLAKKRSANEGFHWLAAIDSKYYHRADCWRVKRILEKHRIGFACQEDAWLFGFEPCLCVKEGGEQLPEVTLLAGYGADAKHLKHSFDFPYYGNVKSRELHIEPCVRLARDIPLSSRIGFHDLDEAHALDFDNCAYCLGNSKR